MELQISESSILLRYDNGKQSIPMEINNECLEWRGAVNENGYARVHCTSSKKKEYLHRMAFHAFNGFWPKECRHTCDTPRCFNPRHLVDGTHADNMRDMAERGRGARKTICVRGHVLPPFVPGRRCKTCNSEYNKAWKADRKARVT